MEHVWNFYEWDGEDLLSYVKQIPLFRVPFETICDFLKYHIVVDDSFVQSILHQTSFRNQHQEDSICFLMSDSKNALAVQLNEQGEVIALSKLLLDEENHLNEFIYPLKETTFVYHKKDKREMRHWIRQLEKMKNFILVELNTLLDLRNVQKMQYLYYEWFHEEENDLEKMYQRMTKSFSATNLEILSHIDYLIRLSYHQV